MPPPDIRNEPATGLTAKSASWSALIVLCLAQLWAMVDPTVMALATKSMVTKFDTTVSAVQGALTMYPLVTGSLMMAGSVAALLIGLRRAFCLGLLVFAGGELMVALAPGMPLLMLGRVVSGIGGAVLIPAIIALLLQLYRGNQRAVAFGALGAVLGIGLIVGNLAGGLIVDIWGFSAAYALLVAAGVATAMLTPLISKVPRQLEVPRFDFIGAVLSTAGAALFLFGILQIASWGLISAKNPARFVGLDLNVAGLSPVPLMLVAGAALLVSFVGWELRSERAGRPVLLPKAFITSPEVRAGLAMILIQFFVTGASTFVVPTFMQIVIGDSAFASGLVQLSGGLGIIIFAIGTPLVLRGKSPRMLCRAGLITGIVGCGVIAAGLQVSSANPLLPVGLFLLGAGTGLLASQNSNTVSSSVPETAANRAGGIQGTARNFGQALGTALVGAILLISLTQGLDRRATNDPLIDETTRAGVLLVTNVRFLSDDQAAAYLQTANIEAGERAELLRIYQDSRLGAARIAVASIAVILLLGLLASRRMPKAPDELPELGVAIGSHSPDIPATTTP